MEKMPPKNKTGAKRAIGVIYDRFRNSLFRSSNSSDNAEPPAKETEAERELRLERENYRQLRKEFEDFKSEADLNVKAGELANAINKFQYFEKELFKGEGYIDGAFSVKDPNISVSANSRASFIVEHANSLLEGRIKGLDDEVVFRRNKVIDLSGRYQREEHFFSQMESLNRSQHRDFSLVMGCVYVIAGICLMTADLPISINISQIFVTVPRGAATFWHKVRNPEVILFSLGITFMTIYFKILYDEFVAHSIIPVTKEAHPDHARRIIRVIVKLLIGCTLVSLLYYLGYVRTAANEAALINKVGKFISPDQVFHYKMLSFLLTTILLPLISGCCLSIGFSIFSNRHNLKQSKRNLASLGEQKRQLETEISELIIVRNMLAELQKSWQQKQEKTLLLVDLFVNAYLQGYRRGHRHRNGDDVFTNASALYLDYVSSKN